MNCYHISLLSLYDGTSFDYYLLKIMLPVVFGIFAIILIVFIFFAIKKKNEGSDLGDRQAGDQR